MKDEFFFNKDNIAELRQQLEEMNPVDIAERLEDSSSSDILVVMKLLDKEKLADTFDELTKAQKQEVIQNLSDADIRGILEELEHHEVVDNLQEMPANIVNRMLKQIEPERRPIINKLLNYPEESVGSIMTVDFIRAKLGRSCNQVKEQIKKSDLKSEQITVVWVVDNGLRLQGYVELADIIRGDEELIDEYLEPIVAQAYTNDDQEEVANDMLRYTLPVIPVVDRENRLVGNVSSEITLDVLAQEFGEDLTNLQGIREQEGEPDSYFDLSVWSIAKSRITWLFILMITATITSYIISSYEAVLASVVALVAYIPMLMDNGGNSGNQSTAMIIRGLTLDDIDEEDLGKVMWKEIRVGVVNGLLLAVVNFARIMIMDGVGFWISFTVSVTLMITVILANTIGGLLPLIAVKLKQDPTVMAGPLITTIVDTTVLLVYFQVAQLLIL